MKDIQTVLLFGAMSKQSSETFECGPVKTMFQQAKEFTTLMQINAKKNFSGKINIDHIARMVSDEVGEFFKPLKDLKNVVLVDGKFNENALPNDPKFYSNLFMQLLDGLFDAQYYTLQHLSTTDIDGDAKLNEICGASSILKNTPLPQDFHAYNEEFLAKAIADPTFEKGKEGIWHLSNHIHELYKNPKMYYDVSRNCFDVVARLSDLITSPFQQAQARSPHTSEESKEKMAQIHLCLVANIISQLILWLCVVPREGESPMFLNSRHIWNLIHAANMTKFGPGGRLEGEKWIKPADFKAPDADIQQFIEDSLGEKTIVAHMKTLIRAYIDQLLFAMERQAKTK